MVEIKPIEDIQDVGQAQWNDLLYKSDNPLPFQRYEWVRHWWENLGKDKGELLILSAHEDNEIVGIAPLMLKRNPAFKFSTAEFIGTGFCDYFDFIIKKGQERQVLTGFIDYIFNHIRASELNLQNILHDSPTLQVLNANKCGKNFYIISDDSQAVPYIELPKTKEQFNSQMRSSLRQDVARQEKRLRKFGDLGFSACRDLAESAMLLEDFFSLHIKKWESQKGYSVFKFGSRRIFLRNLLNALFGEGVADIYFLTAGGKKIAICFAFKMKGRFMYYIPAYEPEFASYSPGKVLLSRLINHAVENEFKEFDFGIGLEGYKMQWAGKIRKLYCICIYPNKDVFLSILLRCRRILINGYFWGVLPALRKFSLAVYLWRWINRGRGGYNRFQ